MSADNPKRRASHKGVGKNPFEGMEPFIEAARQSEASVEHELSEPHAQPRQLPSDPVQRAQALAALHACPFIGLLEDPDIRYLGADEGHRCYAGRRPRQITIAYQEKVCLTEHYQTCEIFSQALSRRPPEQNACLAGGLISWIRRLFGRAP